MIPFKDPYSSEPLLSLRNGDLEGKYCYPKLDGLPNAYDFIKNSGEELSLKAIDALRMYSSAGSVPIYINFLDWLYKTFNTTEQDFRSTLIDRMRLRPGMKVLITSVGLGSELKDIHEAISPNGELHFQDISAELLNHAVSSFSKDDINFSASISDAMHLPYGDSEFDLVFHFGGINLFSSVKEAISEMNRVVKPLSGRVIFGDEGIAEHLRCTEYARIAIKNNSLWAEHAPMSLLPIEAENITLEYLLGNCFYLIAFSKGLSLPEINLDVPHKGLRGGSMRSRYFGQLEGIDPDLKEKFFQDCKDSGNSMHEQLNKIIACYLQQSG